MEDFFFESGSEGGRWGLMIFGEGWGIGDWGLGIED